MFYCFSLNFVYIINRKIHGCLEITDLFLVLNMISHSFAALTREISFNEFFSFFFVLVLCTQVNMIFVMLL
jgi:hypothetical protein